MVGFFEGHEQRVVVQPVGVALAELPEGDPVLRAAAGLEAVEGPFEQASFVGDDFLEGDDVVREARWVGEVVGVQQACLEQPLRADEHRIAGEGRGAGVGRIAVGHRPDGQHLPDALGGAGQDVGKAVGGRPQVADAVGRGQRRDVKQQAAGTRQVHGGDEVSLTKHLAGQPARGKLVQ